LERLGRSDGFADAIVALLCRQGWTVGEQIAFASGDVLFLARRQEIEITAAGTYRAQAAMRLLCNVGAFICEGRLAA
jgi:hypothetical protein